MPWAALLPAGASLLGGALSADAAGKASDAQTNAANNSLAEQKREFALTRTDNAPFLKTGTAANARLAQLLGLAQDKGQYVTGYDKTLSAVDPNNFDAKGYLLANPDVAANEFYSQNPLQHYQDHGQTEGRQTYAPIYDNSAMSAAMAPGGDYGSLTRKFTSNDLNSDPVYNSGLQFGLDEGTKAINARALQSGGYDSGATLKALTRFGNDYGSTKANDSYNRFTNDQNNIFNRLSGVSGSGQVATNQIATAGANATNGITNSIDAAGNARAAGIVGGANAWGAGLTGVGGAVNQYQNSEILKKLLAGGGIGGGVGAGTSGYGYNGAAPNTNYYAQD